MSYSSVSCMFSVNESTVQFIQKKEEEIHKSVDKATPESARVISTAVPPYPKLHFLLFLPILLQLESENIIWKFPEINNSINNS